MLKGDMSVVRERPFFLFGVYLYGENDKHRLTNDFGLPKVNEIKRIIKRISWTQSLNTVLIHLNQTNSSVNRVLLGIYRCHCNLLHRLCNYFHISI